MSFSDPVKEFEGKLGRAENKSMIEFLKQYQPSAHGDIVELLTQSTRDLADINFYCPDTDNYAYYVAHTKEGVIFAAAIGMSGLLYRLPKQAVSGALSKGGEIFKELGDNWVNFNPFWPEQENTNKNLVKEMQHWCKLAYHHALSLEK